jgi:hypothetical protein
MSFQPLRTLWPISIFAEPHAPPREDLVAAASDVMGADRWIGLRLATTSSGYIGMLDDDSPGEETIGSLAAQLGNKLSCQAWADWGLKLTDQAVLVMAGSQDLTATDKAIAIATRWANRLIDIPGVWALPAVDTTILCHRPRGSQPLAKKGILAGIPFHKNSGGWQALVDACSRLANDLGAEEFALLFEQEAYLVGGI